MITLEINSNSSLRVDTDKRVIHVDSSSGGVHLSKIYSIIKSAWRDNFELIKFPFPFLSISHVCFECMNDWVISEETRENVRGGQCKINGEIHQFRENFDWNNASVFIPNEDEQLLLRCVYDSSDKSPIYLIGKYERDTAEFIFDHEDRADLSVTHFMPIFDVDDNEGYIIEEVREIRFGTELIIDIINKTISIVGKSKDVNSNIFDNTSYDKSGVNYKTLVAFFSEEYPSIVHPAARGAGKDISKILKEDWSFKDDYSKSLIRPQ